MNSTQYDELIKKSIGEKHLLDGFYYYDEVYCKELKKNIKDKGFEDAFSEREYQEYKNGRIKICSVASSARLGYLYGMQYGITEFEKTDIKNGICKPHYDNYDPKSNTFYEYKCHEFLTAKAKEYNIIKNKKDEYKLLISKYFTDVKQVDVNDLYRTFDIDPYLNFDFKQLVCHILGLLGNVNLNKKTNLQYIMFIPSENVIKGNKDVSKFLDENRENINRIFKIISKQKVCVNGNDRKCLSEYINLSFDYVDVSKVKDFVYKQVENL